MLDYDIDAVLFGSKITRYFALWVAGGSRNPVQEVKFSGKILVN